MRGAGLFWRRHAAMAAILLLLGGCSDFGLRDEAEAPADIPQIASQIPNNPVAGARVGDMPGYPPDQDTALDKIDEIKGHAGNRPPWSAAAVQGYPIKFLPTVKDPRSAREGLDRHPIPASFKPGSHSLADLVADREWRKRTSEMLKRLFR